jgi:hypothetical protein
LPQAEDNELNLVEVMETANGSRLAKGQELEILKADMLAFLDNARAVATKERSEIKVTTDSGKIRLEVVTANGSTKAVLKASCTTKDQVLVDFEFLDEAVRKSAESVNMKIVKDEFLSLKLKTGTVVVSLNQEA